MCKAAHAHTRTCHVSPTRRKRCIFQAYHKVATWHLLTTCYPTNLHIPDISLSSPSLPFSCHARSHGLPPQPICLVHVVQHMHLHTLYIRCNNLLSLPAQHKHKGFHACMLTHTNPNVHMFSLHTYTYISALCALSHMHMCTLLHTYPCTKNIELS